MVEVTYRRSGREREAESIRQANRAAAVGRLMLGELKTWHEFLQAEVIELESLPRRNLKAGLLDVKGRLSQEIKRFCSKNFRGLDESKLSSLYEDIKSNRGLELPLPEFEDRFAPLRPETLKGNPAHLTICISLWGLQFKFPEHELAKDLGLALHLASQAQDELRQHERKTHLEARGSKDEVASLLRRKDFAIRSAFQCCFTLLEAYLNGLAWEYMQTHNTTELSNRKRKLLEDATSVSIRDKLEKYPELLTGKKLWQEPDEELDTLISTLKPFRDSLVHPSPFSAPERFGGYDKLRLFYRIDWDTVLRAAILLVTLIQRIHTHVHGDVQKVPGWISDLESEIKKLNGHTLASNSAEPLRY